MKRVLLAATILAAVGANPVKAATVTVADVGSILNESVALPAEATPGAGVPFAQFFTFSLPTTETVTASVSDSGIGAEAVIDGILSLNTQTSRSGPPLLIPAGVLISSSPLVNTPGGQDATTGPDILGAGAYFVEVSGTSGPSALHLAIDGTVTATTSVPEPSTWALLLIGTAFMAFGAMTRKRVRELY